MNETIKSVFTCKWCNENLFGPVFLPCGETVCVQHESHFKQLVEKSTPLSCKLCKQDHALNNGEHFPVNKMAQTLLDNEIRQLNFGKGYLNALSNLKKIEDELDKFDEIVKQPEELIFDFFQKKRTEVREELIEKINKYSEKLIADINKYEEECTSGLSSLNEKLLKVFKLSEIKTQFNEWNSKIKRLFIDKELYETINVKLSVYLNTIQTSKQLFLDEIYLGKETKDTFDLKYSDLIELFCKDAGFYDKRKQILEMKINDLSKYRNINERADIKSEPFFINGVPLKINSIFNYETEKKKLSVFLISDATRFECDINVLFEIVFLNSKKEPVFNCGDLTKYSCHNGQENLYWGYMGVFLLENVINDDKYDIYNKQDDSIVMQIHVKNLVHKLK